MCLLFEEPLIEEEKDIEEVVWDEEEGHEETVATDNDQASRGEVCQRHHNQDQQDVHLGTDKLQESHEIT